MNKKNIAIIGHFAFGGSLSDGQTVKTKILHELLKNHERCGNVVLIDTFDWRRRPHLILGGMFRGMLECSDVVVLLSRNGMKVIFPLLYALNKIFQRNIHHVVIGGNLVELIGKNANWVRYLNSFRGNYVEMESIKEGLERLNVKNAFVVPNFKSLEPAHLGDTSRDASPLRLCTFSRVMKEKGVEDAISLVKRMNDDSGRILFTLDIYGQVDARYRDAFDSLRTEFPDYIRYKGIVPYNKTVDVLKNYFMLLFLTHFDSEGVPGTVIDAFASGLPVLTTHWKCSVEMIRHGETGWIIPRGDLEGMRAVLQQCADDKEMIFRMRCACIDEARKYTPATALKPLFDNLFSK